jgi:hypothetical protein
MRTKFIWAGLFLGSTLGSWIPTLWGADMFSLWSAFLSAAGGLLGIYLGWQLTQ